LISGFIGKLKNKIRVYERKGYVKDNSIEIVDGPFGELYRIVMVKKEH